ncbi:uncharacterized protein JCM6883_005589 [Sporobolomyces salmoneus]|uniref:uncharacterized protein n=1 Tax=Sporobolomyces salmoneus TaxID=183962 RepID=UPI00316F2D57
MSTKVELGTVEGQRRSSQDSEESQRTKLNQLSRLPVELLDAIFDLAVSTSDLTAHPISKSLLPSQERAVYQTITIRSLRNFTALLRTLDAQPNRGQHVKRLVWRVASYWDFPIDTEHVLRHLPNLVELHFNENEEVTAFRCLGQPELLSSLRICCFTKTPLNASLFACLSRIPTLRLVEVPPIPKEEEDESKRTPINQVKQIAVNSVGSPETLSVLPDIFPAASISSVELQVDYHYTLRPILDLLDHNLLSLKLRKIYISRDNELIEQLVRRFPNLRHLHLDTPFAFMPFQSHLLGLSNLVSLSLVYSQQHPNLDEVFSHLDDRLRHLRTLTLNYLRIRQGRKFNFDEAREEEYDMDKSRRRPNLALLKDDLDLYQMQDWSLPWIKKISDVLPPVIAMEEKAKSGGLIVASNLEEVVRVFRLQVIECYHRGVGDMWLNERKDSLLYALKLAEKHGLDINRIEPDLEADLEFNDPDLDLSDFELFQTESEALGDGNMCESYGFRYKKTSKRYQSMLKRIESDGSDLSSEESEVDPKDE